jgi:homoserine trans-succinylase
MRGFRGKKALREIKRLKKLIPTAPIELEPKAPYISRSQRSYWKDVKALAKARDMPIKDTRKLLKKLKTAKNVQVRVIKSGTGWQLVMLGLYEHQEKDGEKLEAPFNQEEEEGHSYVHYTDEYHEEEEEAFDECVREAQAKLGGSGWILVKVLKETWIRFYGREK